MSERTESYIVFGLRVCGAVVMGLIGWSLGASIMPLLPQPLSHEAFAHVGAMLAFGVAGGLAFPLLFARPITTLYHRIANLSAAQILAGFMGLGAGLLLAALLAFPLARLPEPFGPVLPFLAAVGFGTLGLGIMSLRYREVFALLNIKLPSSRGADLPAYMREPLLLDTSVIIDGRIADVSATGFLRSELIIPRFVLNELQYIADSPDPMRRARGRRGLEVLRRLQRESPMPVHIVQDDPEEAQRVDEKLIALAKQWNCPIVTNDYNLNRVASLQGVTVLNLNELANAVKTALIPGEALHVRIIQPGREARQGVGYLDDGTMVVVEDGQDFMDRTVEVTVTKVLQTAAGRMIFARPAASQLVATK
ncbi:MAG: TRAM domain-containing protein [Thermoflexales bacterium]|nr:TRAM domain-containing protein [Thermoflexales bacterium]MCS7324391.1 TRAM domain-containing protein [Thermoflexales bacterium]MCX7937812.1 TRAM domain-containing protein [Thermoflexales bacterium]MDW8053284.1 TRAM domain-containing protein [Anaerolineae bacterium]MDW8291935.1 TRAM domain-containing protein [Anaerolineae bacterium]